eukprot:scaffold158868_cov19-Tisochrysis_lutea.AAC.1
MHLPPVLAILLLYMKQMWEVEKQAETSAKRYWRLSAELGSPRINIPWIQHVCVCMRVCVHARVCYKKFNLWKGKETRENAYAYEWTSVNFKEVLRQGNQKLQLIKTMHKPCQDECTQACKNACIKPWKAYNFELAKPWSFGISTV